MKCVGAGLGRIRHDAAAGVPEFGIVILRGLFHFVHGVHGRVNQDFTEDGVLICRPIQFESSSTESLPVDLNLLSALRVLGVVLVPAELGRAGVQEHESLQVPAEVWQILELFRCKRLRHVRTICLQQRSGSGDLNLLGHIAYIKRHIETSRLIDADLEIVGNNVFESRRFDLDAVDTRNELSLRVVAGFIRGHLESRVFVYIRDRDLRVSHRATGFIGDRAIDVAEHLLRR